MKTGKLSIGTKLGFGVCDLGGNLYFTVIAFWLMNYLTDTVHLSAALAGTVVLVGRVWDAVTDPAVGVLSDRTRSRWGRRRPYLLFGALPLAAAMIFMFTVPSAIETQQGLFWWALLAYCLLGTAYTVVIVPYSSLTPELTDDYQERSSLNAYRFVFAILGTLAGAVAVLPLRDAFATQKEGFSAVGILFGLIMALSALITFIAVREPSHGKQETPAGSGIVASYLQVFSCKPYLLITFTYVLHILAITIVSGIMVYYYKYVFRDEGATNLALGLLLVVSIPAIPLSVLISKKIGKKATYALGLGILASMLFLFYFLGERVSIGGSLVIFAVAGIGNGFVFPTPYAMLPDAIDQDYLDTGIRKEGAFYGTWTLLTKSGQGVANGIMGWMLGIAGFQADILQNEGTLGAIRLLLGPIPATVFLLSILVLYFYPINEERYNEIRAGIALREAGRS
jgi:glycoside/pentoside/hexuronide:cation symporter, GPH family